MISVITPVYNGKNFIAACIQNVIEQNCPDIEHIIMDGGSNDGTVEIIQSYASQYSHIHWISEKDQGQSDAMNKGIMMAKGEILGILNVDDYYEPNVLNRALELFCDLPEPSLLVGNCNNWDDDGSFIEVNKPSKLKLNELLVGMYVNPHPANPSAYFYHKSLHDKIGPYDIQEHYAMDLDFIFKAVQVAHVKYVDEIWGNYRKLKDTKTIIHTLSVKKGFRAGDQIRDAYIKKLPVSQRFQVVVLRDYYELLDQTKIAIRKTGKFLLPAPVVSFLKANFDT